MSDMLSKIRAVAHKAELPVDLPDNVDNWSDIPKGQYSSLYEHDERRGGLSLSPIGRQLQKVRRHIAGEPHATGLPKPVRGREPVFALKDWSTALAVATPRERTILLAAKARGDIRVKG